MADDISARCVLCKEGETSSRFVTNPSLDMITSIKDYAIERVELGEQELKPLADYMASLSEAELALVRYHSSCRKTVVHKKMIERAASNFMYQQASAFIMWYSTPLLNALPVKIARNAAGE